MIELDQKRSRSAWRTYFGPDGQGLGMALVVLVVTGGLILESSLSRSRVLRLDLVTLSIVYLALEQELITGLVLTLILGYLGDVSAGGSRGLVTATAVFLFFLLRMIAFRFVRRTWYVITALSVVGVLLALLLTFILESIVGPDMLRMSHSVLALPSLLISAVVLGYPMYRMLQAIEARFRRQHDS